MCRDGSLFCDRRMSYLRPVGQSQCALAAQFWPPNCCFAPRRPVFVVSLALLVKKKSQAARHANAQSANNSPSVTMEGTVYHSRSHRLMTWQTNQLSGMLYMVPLSEIGLDLAIPFMLLPTPSCTTGSRRKPPGPTPTAFQFEAVRAGRCTFRTPRAAYLNREICPE